MDIIKNFFYGKFIPHEIYFKPDKEYNKTLSKLKSKDKQLTDNIDNQSNLLYEEIRDLIAELSNKEAYYAFRLGLSVGLLFMKEAHASLENN